MSNVLEGVFKKTKNNPGVKGKLGRLGEVPVDVLSKINRSTKADLIKKYTKDGFDWNKWSPPIVACRPTGTQYLLDGDHRRHMYKQFHPQATKMPAWIIEVSSDEEFHNLFVEINSTGRKNVSGDEAFIHKVHAGDEKSLESVTDLEYCDLSVKGSPEAGGTVGAEGSRNIKIKSFERACKISDTSSVKKAVETIGRSWDAERYPNWSTKIHGELLQGFSAIYKNYKSLSSGGDMQVDFENWVTKVLSTNPPDVVATDYKSKGGARQHKQGYSIALAIIMEFRKSKLHNALTDVKKRQSSLAPKNIKRFINC